MGTIKMLKNIGKICISGFIALFVLNVIATVYYHKPGYISTSLVGTGAFWKPGSFMTNLMEGVGFYRIDSNGYVNDDLPLESEYTVVIGPSTTEGIQVKKGERFSDLLNSYFATSSDKLAVYNVSMDGLSYQNIAEGFSSYAEQYSDAERIIIQIGSIEVSENADANVQHTYGGQSAAEIVEQLNWKQKMKMAVKAMIPVGPILKVQWTAINKSIFGNASTVIYKEKISAKEYYRKTLENMRNAYDGEIIVVYVPRYSIEKDGSMVVDAEDEMDEFVSACRDNNIGLIDMTEAYEEAYVSGHIVPNGFYNTNAGTGGHLNKNGHRLVAEQIIKYIEEEKRK